MTLHEAILIMIVIDIIGAFVCSNPWAKVSFAFGAMFILLKEMGF